MRECEGRHNRYPIPHAVGLFEGASLCRRCLNRTLKYRAAAEYMSSSSERCPDHTARPPQITRFYGDVRMFCSQPLDEAIITRPSGRGVSRMAAQRVHLKFCQWQHVIPTDDIDRIAAELQMQVLPLLSLS